MKPKALPTLEELQARRLDILGLYPHVKTEHVRSALAVKLQSVNRDLFTLTKNPIYK
jgi:hypothetical protein